VALLTSSECTRSGFFEAGRQRDRDPDYEVAPQRRRISRPAAEGPSQMM
jgi:hypothetical protein